jgi:hypothetical protein
MKTIDAKKGLTVRLTSDNIKKGVLHDSRNCGVELAIEDALPGVRATVNTSTVQILKPNGTIVRYRNSWAGRKFVQDFDAGLKMLPGIIELLPIPPKSIYSKAQLALRARRRRAEGTDFSGKGGHRKLSLRTKLHNQVKAEARKQAAFFV